MRRGLLYSFTYPPMKSKEAYTKKKNQEKKKHDLRKCIIFNETHQIIFKNKTGNNVNQNYRKNQRLMQISEGGKKFHKPISSKRRKTWSKRVTEGKKSEENKTI